jgi:hypothetical protein
MTYTHFIDGVSVEVTEEQHLGVTVQHPPTEDEVRGKRDNLLAATDWTANSDVTMTAEMTTYRQALRDVPAQSGFPDTITWPQEPSA